MLKKASVVLGLAVLLSLLFPIQAVLRESGIDPLALRLRVVDLAVVCALVALLPAFALFHDAQLAHRIPRWNVWVVLLALCSLLFLLLHVAPTQQLATAYAQQALAGRSLPAAITHDAVVRGLELAARLGVLVALVGVLVRLDAAPEDRSLPRRKSEDGGQRRRKK